MTRRNHSPGPHIHRKEKLARDVRVKGRPGSSACEMVKFGILRGGKKGKIRITALKFRRADCSLQVPAWKNPMAYDPTEKRGPGELIDFQDCFL